MPDNLLQEFQRLLNLIFELFTQLQSLGNLLVLLIPVGVIGFWRWGVWLIRKVVGARYRPLVPSGYTTTTSIVTPVYNEDPQVFRNALESWLANSPNEIIAVIDYTDEICIQEFRKFEEACAATGAVTTKLIITRKPGKRAALVDGIILTLGTFFVVFVAQDFLGPFQSFLITLGVPLASWAGIMIADIALRKRDYDDDALFDVRGRYGSWDWVSIATMVLASVIGWGLVVNNFAQDAAWNNWQGYLLEPLGLGTYVDDPAGGYWEGAWPYANLGVLLALVLSFAVTYVARRAKVQQQEALVDG